MGNKIVTTFLEITKDVKDKKWVEKSAETLKKEFYRWNDKKKIFEEYDGNGNRVIVKRGRKPKKKVA